MFHFIKRNKFHIIFGEIDIDFSEIIQSESDFIISRFDFIDFIQLFLAINEESDVAFVVEVDFFVVFEEFWFRWFEVNENADDVVGFGFVVSLDVVSFVQENAIAGAVAVAFPEGADRNFKVAFFVDDADANVGRVFFDVV